LVFTTAGTFATTCQQTGAVNELTDSSWTTGAFVCQEITTLPLPRVIANRGVSPEVARKLSAKTLLLETSVVSEESPITAMLIVLALLNPQPVPISSARSNVHE